MQEVSIYGVSFDMVGKQPIVLLKTLDGNKFLPIWIGHPEAAAILVKLQGSPTPRPMTHDLVADMLGEMNAQVTKIAVTELRESTFYAVITLQVNGSEIDVDSRPSDALALAVRTSAPIFVADQVIDDSAIEFGGEPEDEAEVVDEFKKFLENVNPDDFAVTAANRRSRRRGGRAEHCLPRSLRTRFSPSRSGRLRPASRSRAITSRCTSAVPSTTCSIFASAMNRASGWSFEPAVGAQHLAAGDRRAQGGVRREPLRVRHRHRPLRRAQPFRCRSNQQA